MVHKKKIDAVKQWLQTNRANLKEGRQVSEWHAKRNSIIAQAPRLLVLSGPPGCGKTAMLKVLTHELGFRVLEWLNPVHLSWRNSAGERCLLLVRMTDGALKATTRKIQFISRA